jgi:hypothetical protein
VRQVAPELLKELDEPYAELWRLLVDRHGPADAARAFARVLDAVCAHGESTVGRAIQQSLAAGKAGVLPIPRPEPAQIAVPEPLRHYVVEVTPAAAFDALLAEGVSHV